MRISAVLAFLGLVVWGVSASQIETVPPNTEIYATAIADLRKQMIASERHDEATMDEISARLAWVLRGDDPLPEEARRRTILRMNNPRPDKIGPLGFREDMAPSKRALCFAILTLDDKIRREL